MSAVMLALPELKPAPGPEYITEREIGMAFGKGRMGHTGGFVRHRRDDMRVERHDRRPLADRVKARQLSGSVLCHTSLPRSTPRVKKCSSDIVYYINSFCSKLTEKISLQTHAEARAVVTAPAKNIHPL